MIDFAPNLDEHHMYVDDVVLHMMAGWPDSISIHDLACKTGSEVVPGSGLRCLSQFLARKKMNEEFVFIITNICCVHII